MSKSKRSEKIRNRVRRALKRGLWFHNGPHAPPGYGPRIQIRKFWYPVIDDPTKEALALCAEVSCWRGHDKVWTKKDGVVQGDEWWSFEFTRETFEYMVTRLRKMLGNPTTSARVFGRQR